MDVVGDDEDEMDAEGLATMGAARARPRLIKVPTPRWMRGTTSQGVSRPQEELDYLPFTPLTLDDVAPSGFILSRPQRPFRGERLVLAAFSATVVAPADAVVIDPAIYVGATQVGASQGATPIATFAATAFGIRLSFPPAGQGTDMKVFLRLVGPIGVGNSITITGTIIGRAMR
jgi:hypothetical protein